MAIIRPFQRALTSTVPHQGNRRFFVPNVAEFTPYVPPAYDTGQVTNGTAYDTLQITDGATYDDAELTA